MGRRTAYDAAFKLKVVALAEDIGNRAAGKKLEVNEKQVRDWRKQKVQLEAVPKSKKALRGLKNGAIPRMEEALKASRTSKHRHMLFPGARFG